MKCKDVEILLAAMVEGALSAEESRSVEAHLRSCESCRKAREDLKKADERVKSLEEIDPPSWLKTRVMARVREEAQQEKGFLRKLFYPLHVKVPIQALATVLIAVVAWNVYKTGEPEYRQVIPPAATQEMQKERSPAEAPRAVDPAVRPQKDTVSGKSAPEKKGVAAPSPGQEAQTELPKALIRERAKADEPTAAAPQRAEEYAAAPVKDGAIARGTASVNLSEKKEAAPPPDTQSKQKVRDAAAGSVAGESKKQAVPAAVPPALSKAAPARPAPEILLQVRNAAEAAGVVENEVKRLGGGIPEKRTLGGEVTLNVRIGADRIEALRAKIRSLGVVRENFSETMGPDAEGFIAIRIGIRQD